MVPLKFKSLNTNFKPDWNEFEVYQHFGTVPIGKYIDC